MKEISLNPPGGAVPLRTKFLLKASSSTSPNDTAFVLCGGRSRTEKSGVERLVCFVIN